MGRNICSNIFLPIRYILIGALFNLVIVFLGEHGYASKTSPLIFSGLIFIAVIALSLRRHREVFFICLLSMGIQGDSYRYIISFVIMVCLGLASIRRHTVCAASIIKIKKHVLIWVGYLFVLAILFQGTYSDFWSLPLYLLTFMTYPLTAIFFLSIRADDSDIDFFARAILTIILVHTLVVFVSPIISTKANFFAGLSSLKQFLENASISTPWSYYGTGDYNTSTLSSSSNTGNLSLFLISFLATFILYEDQRRKWYFVLLALSGYVFLMTDTKHAYLGLSVAVFIVMTILKGQNLSRVINWLYFTSMAAMLVGVIVIFPLLVQKTQHVSESLITGTNNPKFTLYNRCIENNLNHPILALVGRGAGTFGSRVSSSRATRVLYKPEVKIPGFIPEFYNKSYAKIMRGLYSKSFTKNTSKSGALMNPFASMIGMVMEMGLVGSGIFFALFYRLVRVGVSFCKDIEIPFWKSYGVMVCFAIVLMVINTIFLQYFEHPAIMLYFWFMIGTFLLKVNQFYLKLEGK